MATVVILIAVVAVLAVVLVVALVVPQRIASRTSTHPRSDVDDEAEAWRHHTPGGNTGGL